MARSVIDTKPTAVWRLFEPRAAAKFQAFERVAGIVNVHTAANPGGEIRGQVTK